MNHSTPSANIRKRRGIYDAARRDVTEKEGLVWGTNQRLRKQFERSHPTLFAKIPITSLEAAREKSFGVISRTLAFFDGIMDLGTVDPGHGIGHLARDYLHAVVLAGNTQMDPRHAYIGMVGGALHDILGCTLMPRYEESRRAVRHAEAGGYLFHKIHRIIDTPPEDALLIHYAIAAHTNSGLRSSIKCRDGVSRDLSPYIDSDGEGSPILGLLLTKWADRFDANGPCFIGRHFLTLVDDHQDQWAGKNTIQFSPHMRPLLRSEEEIAKDSVHGRTMREHVMKFLQSHSNSSSHGRFDYGGMAAMREAYKARGLRIVASFDTPIVLSLGEESSLLDAWFTWLSEKIEPSESAKRACEKLRIMFGDLPLTTKQAWYSAMRTTLKEYREWSQEMKVVLGNFPEERLILPVLGDIRKII